VHDEWRGPGHRRYKGDEDAARVMWRNAMAKGQENPGKNNKPKLTTKEKQEKKKAKKEGK
jgi:hypothetical protein